MAAAVSVHRAGLTSGARRDADRGVAEGAGGRARCGVPLRLAGRADLAVGTARAVRANLTGRYEAHRDERDDLTVLITATGVDPVASLVDYRPPGPIGNPVQVKAAARTLETRDDAHLRRAGRAHLGSRARVGDHRARPLGRPWPLLRRPAGQLPRARLSGRTAGMAGGAGSAEVGARPGGGARAHCRSRSTSASACRWSTLLRSSLSRVDARPTSSACDDEERATVYYTQPRALDRMSRRLPPSSADVPPPGSETSEGRSSMSSPVGGTNRIGRETLDRRMASPRVATERTRAAGGRSRRVRAAPGGGFGPVRPWRHDRVRPLGQSSLEEPRDVGELVRDGVGLALGVARPARPGCRCAGRGSPSCRRCGRPRCRRRAGRRRRRSAPGRSTPTACMAARNASGAGLVHGTSLV